MNTTLPWEAQLVLAALAGLVCGLLIMWLILRSKVNQNRQDRETLMQEFGQYRQKVDEHFIETAAAVDDLNRSYQKVIQHFSKSAHSLMDKKTLQEQLNKRSGAAVTLAYLSHSDHQDSGTPDFAVPPPSVMGEIEGAGKNNDADIALEEQTPVSDIPVIDPPALAQESWPQKGDEVSQDAEGQENIK
ncbi:YhcB family protein [Neisseria dumasiana]|uniref:YhcB family protein n=1 Tax=Neisseria dumasiana TaxID=1931275 RepID=UPI000A2466F9|nr:DUF1043 family protein [Neisseria dumasiana]OSI16941.1 hypothetical protein BV914_01980 [Neisseria dumasiana]